jgi:hypothetical protein
MATPRHITQNAMLLRFITKQERRARSLPSKATNPVSQPMAPVAQSSPATLPSPFLPHKVSGSSRWQPPQIGRRVWKKLFVASDFGRAYPMPEGPKGKAEKLLARENARVKAADEERELLELARVHWPPAEQVTGFDGPQKKAYLEAQGPYRGRFLGEDAGRAFKGHKWVNKQKERHQITQQRLGKMDQAIADLQKVRFEATISVGC